MNQFPVLPKKDLRKALKILKKENGVQLLLNKDNAQSAQSNINNNNNQNSMVGPGASLNHAGRMMQNRPQLLEENKEVVNDQ